MVVEVAAIGLVLAADIDDKDAGIVEIGGLGITAPHGQSVPRNEEATSEEVVFVGAPGMGENGFHGVAARALGEASRRDSIAWVTLSGSIRSMHR